MAHQDPFADGLLPPRNPFADPAQLYAASVASSRSDLLHPTPSGLGTEKEYFGRAAPYVRHRHSRSLSAPRLSCFWFLAFVYRPRRTSLSLKYVYHELGTRRASERSYLQCTAPEPAGPHPAEHLGYCCPCPCPARSLVSHLLSLVIASILTQKITSPALRSLLASTSRRTRVPPHLLTRSSMAPRTHLSYQKFP